MKPSKLYEALHALIGERVPLHIWGACGVGKSQIVAQVARISTSLSLMCAPCNSILSICAVCPESSGIKPSGFAQVPAHRRQRHSLFWTS